MSRESAGLLRAGSRRIVHKLDYGNNEVVRRFVEAAMSGSQPLGISANDGRLLVETIEQAHAARSGA